MIIGAHRPVFALNLGILRSAAAGHDALHNDAGLANGQLLGIVDAKNGQAKRFSWLAVQLHSGL